MRVAIACGSAGLTLMRVERCIREVGDVRLEAMREGRRDAIPGCDTDEGRWER